MKLLIDMDLSPKWPVTRLFPMIGFLERTKAPQEMPRRTMALKRYAGVRPGRA